MSSGEETIGMDPLDDLIDRLERAAEQLRSGELSADAAATLVEDCAALATQASAELESRARSELHAPAPGQDSLL
jgi:exonuclease VII small subunit